MDGSDDSQPLSFRRADHDPVRFSAPQLYHATRRRQLYTTGGADDKASALVAHKVFPAETPHYERPNPVLTTVQYFRTSIAIARSLGSG